MIRVQSLAVLLLATIAVFAQEQSGTVPVVPSVVKYAGVLVDGKSRPIVGAVEVTFSLYKTPQGGAALWMESQKVQADSLGNYAVMLGSTTIQGLPSSLFVAGEARWLGVQVEGQPEATRVMLLSVPYALKAGDSETLGGLPASAFVLAAPAGTVPQSAPAQDSQPLGVLPPALSGTGTTNFVPLWTNITTLGNSVLFQAGTGTTTKVGINTTTPATTLDVKGTATVRGDFGLPATGVATATAGRNSQSLTFSASVFNSSSTAAVNQNFRWQAEPAGNNTASPGGTLNLLYASGSAVPAETGLKINNKGLFTFATGQTFPGTSTITSVNAGAGLTGGGSSGVVILSLDSTKVVSGVTAGTDLTGGGTGGVVTLNLDTTKVPQLKSNNAFTGTQQFANTGVGTAPSNNTYTPLSVGSANSFGTWFTIGNSSSGGHTWNLISAGGGNAEGAGNFGITDLTGKSTIWLEGNTNTSNLVATGSAGGSIIDADVQGQNNASSTPGLRFGGSSSGETIASNRNINLNRFGLDFYTNFAPRVSITQSGQMGIATQVPRNQLDVLSQSTQYSAIYAAGASAAGGSGANGGEGIAIYAGDGDPGSGTGGGTGVITYGGNGPNYGGDGIDAFPGSPFGLAGFFNGNVIVNGDVDANNTTIKIDHPLDPSNKYLSHSAVESPDMMNIYNGIATLDASGEIAITMPDWFSALNRDFRYQLTAIGAPGPNLYIAEKLTNNQFRIAGGKPGMEVSWQITGIRHDAWADAHRTPVEQMKSDRERGFYLHPELFGAPEEKSEEWARHPEAMRRTQQLRKNATRARSTAAATAGSKN